MSEPVKIGIDLSGKKKPAVQDAFFKWAINGGKVMIILTELAALAALSYRFMVDATIVDQNDEIKTQEIFVKGQSSQEKQFREIHKRLEQIKKISDQSSQRLALINDILGQVNSGSFSSTNITINADSINLNGQVFSVAALNDFIEELKKQPTVEGISLQQVTSAQQGIRFNLTIELITQEIL